MPKSARQSVLFPDVFSKPVVATFTRERTSTDGGSVLLLPVDREMKLTESLAAVMDDRRQAGKIEHDLLELLRQRVFGIVNGYPDGNDAARLARDPMALLACERSPETGTLASQPTLSRFENAMRPRTLLAMAEQLARGVFEEYHGHHDMENRIKEIKCDLRMDRTRCESFAANQLRLLLALAAAALLQAFQQKLPAGAFRGAQMATLRERPFKRAVQVKESARRVLLNFSAHYPWQEAWCQMALAVGAASG